jgi:hypothetical protein
MLSFEDKDKTVSFFNIDLYFVIDKYQDGYIYEEIEFGWTFVKF